MAEKAKLSQAIVGRMSCGHVVAIDLDPSAKTRREYAKLGYDVLTLPTSEALKVFSAESIVHLRTCKGQRKD